MNYLKKYQGFTLIELMIVVAIVGILSAIAYPSYTDYILKSHRSDGMDALTSAMQKQEVFYANNAAYTNDEDALGLTLTSLDGYYLLAFVGCAAQTCTMTATPQGRQGNDKVKSFTLSSTGLKTADYDGTDFNSWTNF